MSYKRPVRVWPHFPRIIMTVLLLMINAGIPHSAQGAFYTSQRVGPMPGLGAGQHRHPVSVADAPWRILGRVQTELGGRCTGFAVAPRVIMTAAHCFWLPKVRRFIPAQDIHALMGYERGTFRVSARGVALIIAPGFDPDKPLMTPFADRATLILDRPVIRTSELVPFAQDVASGSRAMLVGYAQDRPELAYGDTDCHVTGVDAQGAIRHDCAATRGDSGAPLLVAEPRGQWGLAGLMVDAESGRGGLAAPLPSP